MYLILNANPNLRYKNGSFRAKHDVAKISNLLALAFALKVF